MGGGSAPTRTQVTNTTSNLPEYARPYFENIVQRAQAESYRPYTPYEDQRIADFSQQQQQVHQDTAGLQRPGQFGTASQLATTAGIGSLLGSQHETGRFQSGTFGNPQAQQYMSPFFQNVVDVQKREAVRDAQIGQLGNNLMAARQGTYGGARQLLAQTERERNLGMQLGDIQARGSQAAFDNAQQQFERDRGAFMDAQRMTEQSRQFGSTLGLQGMGQSLEAAGVLGNLGQAEQGADLRRLQFQSAVGAEQQQQQQRMLDQNYADFLRQRDFPMEQLGYFSSILQGFPLQLNSAATTYAQPPSMAAQVGGLGLGGLGLYNMTRGGGGG